MLLAHADIQPGQGHTEGRRLLAELYQQKTGETLPPIAVTKLGKPYFADGNLHFSITHTDHHVFCALSESPIGIDAEELTRKIDPRLAEKLLSPTEKVRYDAAPDKARALLTLWVLKEAQGKLEGRGMQLWPNHTDFSLEDPRVQISQDCLLAVLVADKENDYAF